MVKLRGIGEIMLLKFGSVAALLLMFTAPALADNACTAPLAPAAVDGAKVTKAQMSSAHDDVVDFIKASDQYQSCLFADLDKQRADAAKQKDPKPLDPSIEQGVQAKINANQKMKEKVGGEYNAAVHAYKAAHPGG